jgi:uncharacterized protein YutE (UPF0331/DUF86 family)/predicted nucleotidyltransferase
MSSLAPPVSTTKLKEGIRRALEAHEEITVAYLYGSTVKGIAGEESDIDVGLLLRDGFTCGALYPARIAGEIGRSIGLRRDVDVRVLNSQSTRFQYRVVKEGEVILCRDEDRRVAFETRAAAGYLDLKHRDAQAAKYSLLEIIESCIGIANHIISMKAFRRAEKYSDMFRVLREEGVLGERLTQRLEDMARFRNLLVHRYGEIDDERVLEIIQHNLGDIVEFEKQIQRFVDEQPL